VPRREVTLDNCLVKVTEGNVRTLEVQIPKCRSRLHRSYLIRVLQLEQLHQSAHSGRRSDSVSEEESRQKKLKKLTSPPLAVLSMIALGFIILNSLLPIKPLVSSMSGQCKETMSDSFKSCSRVSIL
jgi:hypothetical protein